MPSYRLLRNNKESGPYTINDLVTLGLKPYDLVWVEGRSAAWRYPSEISELKEFAPVVEEQPFDRFYKKQADTSLETPKNEQASEETLGVTKTEEIKTEVTPPPFKKSTSKQVFVSMPGKLNGVQQEQKKEEVKQYQQYQQYQPKTEPVEEKPQTTINIQESEESKLETKYSQSLDDIKEMYINTLVQRKTRNRRKELAKKYAKPVLAALILLVAGAALGYMITGKNSPQVQAVQTMTTNKTPEQKAVESNSSTVNPALQDLQPEKKEDAMVTPQNKKMQEEYLDAKLAVKRKQKESDKQVQEEVKKQDISTNNALVYEKKNVEIDPGTGERRKATRDDKEPVLYQRDEVVNKKENNNSKSERYSFIETSPKDLTKLVTVRSNNYVRGAFGGIKDLQLTLHNNSDFLIDEVKVELQIMKPSEQPLRTDIITFKNIGPNATVTVKVPDSQRGVRVDYKIKNIESKQFEKGTAGL